VTVLESGTHLGRELAIVRRWRVLHEIRVHGGQLITGASVSAIEGHCVRYQLADGTSAQSEADSVVLAIGAQPDTGLLDELTRAGLSASSIGDCHSIGYIEGAISAGHKAGREA